MIKPEELRPKNIVWEEYSGEMIVDSVHRMHHEDSYDIYLYKEEGLPIECQTFGSISGIPLTPEWLERFDLKKTGVTTHYVTDKNSYPHYHFASGEICFDPKENAWDFWIECLHDNGSTSVFPLDYSIQYVHEAQNLFYFLTGKELELKQ